MSEKNLSVLDASRIIVKRLGRLLDDLGKLDDPGAKKLRTTYRSILRDYECIERCTAIGDLNSQRQAFRRLCGKSARIMRLLGTSGVN